MMGTFWAPLSREKSHTIIPASGLLLPMTGGLCGASIQNLPAYLPERIKFSSNNLLFPKDEANFSSFSPPHKSSERQAAFSQMLPLCPGMILISHCFPGIRIQFWSIQQFMRTLNNFAWLGLFSYACLLTNKSHCSQNASL